MSCTVLRSFILVAACLTAPVWAGVQNRALTYPSLTEAGAAPPRVRIAAGAAARIELAGETLSAEPGRTFVTAPAAFALAIDRTGVNVFVPAGTEPAKEGTLFVGTGAGTAWTFTLRVAAPGEDTDARVVVQVPLAADSSSGMDRAADTTACEASRRRLEDALADAEEDSVERRLRALAALLADPATERVTQRGIRWNDKQSRMLVRFVDAVHIGPYTFLRLELDNRDGGGKHWEPGEVTAAVVDAARRRTPLVVTAHFARPSLAPGERGRVVLALEAPQLAPDDRLELGLPEAQGQRHLLVEDLAP